MNPENCCKVQKRLIRIVDVSYYFSCGEEDIDEFFFQLAARRVNHVAICEDWR